MQILPMPQATMAEKTMASTMATPIGRPMPPMWPSVTGVVSSAWV